MRRIFQRYLLPGFVFQSAVIAGGYGTGRELAEFFLPFGPLGGLLAMLLISMTIWSAVCAASFEFARAFESYDYRSFFKHLLGRYWFLYEIIYFLQIFLVLAVVAAAAGAILEETFGLPDIVGVVGMMAAVGLLALWGTGVIEKFLAAWSFLLYGVYLVFFGLCFASFGDGIVESLTQVPIGSGWALGGLRYAAYNLALVPALTFCVRHIETRREAVGAGLLAGPIAIIPGMLFFLAMVGQYPAIQAAPVPANVLLEILGSRAFQLTFQVVLFGTLIETGIAMVHGVNERLARTYEERRVTMPQVLRPTIAICLLILGALLARVGIIDLIARGYGTITWFFLAIYVIPILTLGVRKAWLRGAEPVVTP